VRRDLRSSWALCPGQTQQTLSNSLTILVDHVDDAIKLTDGIRRAELLKNAIIPRLLVVGDKSSDADEQRNGLCVRATVRRALWCAGRSRSETSVGTSEVAAGTIDYDVSAGLLIATVELSAF
jgi:hypothetical protein